jgi:uncharacterized protein YkwD
MEVRLYVLLVVLVCTCILLANADESSVEQRLTRDVDASSSDLQTFDTLWQRLARAVGQQTTRKASTGRSSTTRLRTTSTTRRRSTTSRKLTTKATVPRTRRRNTTRKMTTKASVPTTRSSTTTTTSQPSQMTSSSTTTQTTQTSTTTTTSSTAVSFTTFQQQSLTAHNNYRATHCAPALILNVSLNTIAQTYAEELAVKKVFQHSGNGYGENLWSFWRSVAIDVTQLDGKYIGDTYERLIGTSTFSFR